MFGKAATCRTLVGIVTLALMVMLPWAAWGGPAPQTLKVEKPSVMEGRPIMTDNELNNMRGRDGEYLFGVNITIDLTKGGFPTVDPFGNVTSELVPTNGGLAYKYNDINDNNKDVNWEGGLGPGNVHNMLQINASMTKATGVVNLDLVVPPKLIDSGRPLPLSIPKPGNF
jgi:hypothetical protein